MSDDLLSLADEGGALPQAARAGREPSLRLGPDGRPSTNAAFRLKAWEVRVRDYGSGRYIAATRGKALADAWRCDAFGHMSFKDFLKIARCSRDEPRPEFGAAITVGGTPAFFVDSNRAYVTFARPGGTTVMSAHPFDVEPECYRPTSYRTAQADRSPQGGDGFGSIHEGTVAASHAPLTPCNQDTTNG